MSGLLSTTPREPKSGILRVWSLQYGAQMVELELELVGKKANGGANGIEHA